MLMNEKRKYGAMEQCRAVLLLWSERKSAAEICKGLKIGGSLLALWQEKAMEGLISSLSPREGREVAEKGPALSVRLKRLLERKSGEQDGQKRAQVRLAGLVKNQEPAPMMEG